MMTSYSTDLDTYLKYLEIVFQRLLESGLKLKEIKCNFLKKTSLIFR